MGLASARASHEWIDISVPLLSGMPHWPGDPPVRIERVQSLARDGANVSRLDMSAHSGTHVDAPAHFVAGGAGIADLPFDALTGPARVVHVQDPHVVNADALQALRIARGERLLIRTRNSDRPWYREPFRADFVHLTPDAALWLADRRPSCVGIDYLSISAADDDPALTHRALLEAGVWIIEGLDLSSAAAGRYELVCLPLRIAGVTAPGAPTEGSDAQADAPAGDGAVSHGAVNAAARGAADGAPARAILRPRGRRLRTATGASPNSPGARPHPQPGMHHGGPPGAQEERR
ncbi:MAG: cyclase family protein [Vicinamibacterales bacterium]